MTSRLTDLWKGRFCSPSIEKCANFLRTHSLISFPALRFQLLGYDFQKPHFLNGAIYKEVQYFRGSSFMYIFMSTEIKTILNSTRLQTLPSHNVEIILCCQQQHCYPASLRQPLWCFFFSFYNLKILQLFKIKCLLCHNECISILIVSTEWTILV